jgi:hypothetical protein
VAEFMSIRFDDNFHIDSRTAIEVKNSPIANAALMHPDLAKIGRAVGKDKQIFTKLPTVAVRVDHGAVSASSRGVARGESARSVATSAGYHFCVAAPPLDLHPCVWDRITFVVKDQTGDCAGAEW